MSCCSQKEVKPFTEHSLVKAGKSIIKHMTNASYDAFVSEKEKMARVEICEACDQLESFLGKKRCKICLCFIDIKASLRDQSCPHKTGDKWQEKQ